MENSELSLDIKIKDKYKIISLIGYIDGSLIENIRQEIKDSIKKKPYPTIFNLSKLNHISSSLIALFFDINNFITEKTGRPLIINSPNSKITTVLKLVKIEQIVTLTNKLEDAKKIIYSG